MVHPNKPSGHATGQPERERLERLCARHGLALIVDEVFLDYPLRDEIRLESFARGPHPVLTFVLSGLSKVAGLPQMKVAWLAACGPPGEQTEALARLEVIADTFLSMNTPSQLGLPAWLAGKAAMQRQILERVRMNLRILDASTLERLELDAGWSAILRLDHEAGDSDESDGLLREHGVVVHPGEFYGMAERDRVVVSLLTPEAEFAAGIHRLEAHPARYRHR